MQETPPGLDVKDLVRHYFGRAVVDHVSFQVERGKVTCLLGPSGCGKSTTLRMIAGVEQQDGGEIRVDGRLLSDGRTSVPPEQRQIGLMFQDFSLFPHLKVSDNVAFGLKGDKGAKLDRVRELLRQVGLGQYENAYPHELSGGEQQRVALARALAPRPSIMLMDEPFSGLDNRLRDGIRDDTLEILRAAGTAVLLVTHEPEEAMRMADNIALMRDGRVVQHGTPFHVYTAPVDRAAVAFFSDVNVFPARVSEGRVDCVFGAFPATDLSDGALAEVVVRPQHVKVEFYRGGNAPAETPEYGQAVCAEVVRARFMGVESLVEFRLESDGSMVKATVPNVFVPRVGMKMWLMVPRKKCFVFPAD